MNILRIIVLGSWLTSALFGTPRLQQTDPPPSQAADASRLVVFEGFLRSGCSQSAATAVAVIDPLAIQYEGRAVFIEYNVDAVMSMERQDRWWAGSAGLPGSLPLTMVDSGYRTHAGYTAASYAQHETMVEDALARPPEANITATWERVGNAVRFAVRVTNKSGHTLDTSNAAAVHVIVYEDAYVQYTGRFARAHAAAPISSLGNNATKDYVATTQALSGVDWSKLHFIALVDYQTDTGPYDMLQATIATPLQASLAVTPASLLFSAPAGGPAPSAKSLSVLGASGTAWSVTSSVAWIDISPSTGTIPAQPQVTIDPTSLGRGIYTGKLTFRADSSQDVNIVAAIGDLEWVYLPFVTR